MGSDSEISSNKAKTNGKRYICHYSDCLAAYNRPSKLNRHIRSHTKERPFKCDYPNCDKDYTNNSHLRRHVRVFHAKADVPVVYINCPFGGCLKVFQNKYSLKKHCKTHQSNPYNCPECGEQFKKKHQLISHSYKHNGQFPFSCIHCNESFATERELTSHGKKHRMYVCEYMECREKFTAWSLLRKHFKLKHKRLYECDFCKRTFINKNTMMKHILTHLNMPSPEVYPCPHKDCLRFYTYKRNLTHHIKTSHEGKVYECTEQDCKQIFKSKTRLKDHLTRHKNGTLNLPRVIDHTKLRKPRKDKGLSRKSMAGLLSGIILPPNLDKSLAQNTVTTEVEEDIECTIDVLRKLPNEELPVEECINATEAETDPSCSIMYIIDSRRLKC